MPNPTVNEYLELSEDVYDSEPAVLSTPGGTVNASGTLAGLIAAGTLTTYDGMTVIAQSPGAETSDGFAAIAVRDASGNVIIINEGTIPGADSFDLGTMSADKLIAQGLAPNQIPAIQDAAVFANAVQDIVGNSTPIYVTGHSLGGAEAEEEAHQLVAVDNVSSSLVAGATFGAPGLPGQTSAGGPTNLIDYVDYGDPVGNDARDTANETLNPLYPNATVSFHYGQVRMVGPQSNAVDLQNAAAPYALSIAYKLYEASNPSYSSSPISISEYFSLLTIGDESGSLHDHYLANYAGDILGSGNNLDLGPAVGLSVGWVAIEAGAPYGNVAASDPADQTVQSNGTVSDPDFTVSYNTTTNQITIDQTSSIATSQGTAVGGGVTTLSLDPTTDLVESATYISSDGSTYNATLSEATGNIQSIEVNESSGASYQTNYTYNANGSISAVTNGYSGTNLSGTLQFTETVNVSSAGGFSADISGTGDAATFDNAAITLASNASASLTGTGNSIILGAGASVSDTSADLASDNITFNGTTGKSITLDAGAFSAASSYTNSGTQNISLTTSDGVNLGTLTFNTTEDTDSFTLTDGTVLSLPGISGNVTVSPDTTSGATPDQVLQSYLTNDLGYTGTLSTANYNYLNPTGTTHTVTGTVSGSTDTFNLGTNPAPGAVITGITGDTNILSVSTLTDITQDTITGVQKLQLNSGAEVELTAAQLSEFSSVTGTGTILLTTAGNVSLASSQFSGTFSLEAQSWSSTGTQLTGNNANGQQLIASQFGNDTLTGGNGTGDAFSAGEGVDIITGGTGSGDTYVAKDGLAAGSSITAHGTGAYLLANGDISGATISGIDEFQVGDGSTSTTMTAAQFNSIPNIYSLPGSFTSVTINDAGTYTIDGANFTGTSASTGAGIYFGASTDTAVTIDAPGSASQNVSYNATGSGNISLTLDGNGGELYSGTSLSASGNGNDSLTAMNDNGNVLSASGSGNDTLTAGNGNYNNLSVSGDGTDTLTAGNGNDNTLTASGDGYYTLSTGTGSGDALTLTGDDGMLTADGSGASLSVTGSFNTLTATATGSTLSAQGGDNTLTGGSGDTFNISDGYNTVSTTGSNNTFNLTGTTTGETGVYDYTGLTLNGGTGSNNVLVVDDATLDLTQADITNVAIGSIDNEGFGLSTLIAGAGDLTPLTGLSFVNGTGTVEATQAGTYDVSSLDTTDKITMEDTSTTGGVTLIDNNANGDELSTNRSGDTLIAGSGSNNVLYAETTNDTLEGGNGANDSAELLDGNSSATLGNGASDVLVSYGSGGTLTAGNGTGDTLEAIGNNEKLTAGAGAGDTLEIIEGNNETLTAGGTGATLTASGTGSTLTAAGSGSTLTIAGAGSSATGTGGDDTYDDNATTGSTLIDNYQTSGTGSTLNLGSAFTTSNTLVTQNGNNLLLTENGTTNQVTVENYFEGSDWQVAVDFSGGTDWSASTIEAMLPTPTTLAANTTSTITTNGSTTNVGGSSDVSLSGTSASTLSLYGNNTTASDNSSSYENVLLDGYGDSDNTFQSAGTDDTVTVNGTGDTATVSGNGSWAYVNGYNSTATVSGNGGGLVITGPLDTGTLSGNNATATLSGSVDSASITGTDDTVNDNGNAVTLRGTDDTVTLSGSYASATLSGTGDTATVTGYSNSVTVNEDNCTVTLTSSASSCYVTLNGTNDTVVDNGTGDTTTANSTPTDVTVAGNSGTVWDWGGHNNYTLTGNNLNALLYGSDSTATLSGEDATVQLAGSGESATLNGAGESATLDGYAETATFNGDNGTSNDHGAQCTVTLGGTGDTDNVYGSGETVNLGGSSNTADITSNATSGTATISGTSDTVNIAGTSSEGITFDLNALGTLLLQSAQSFTGTVAGFADGDGIDLSNFQYSNGATISSVTGTGAAGTDTIIKITDGTITAQLALMNQFANQFDVSASAYTLTADGTGSNAGTLLQLAAAH